MARKVTAKTDAIPAPVLSGESVSEGTYFIKNHLNEEIPLPDGGVFKFKATRQYITDAKLVKHLKSVAAQHGILVEE